MQLCGCGRHAIGQCHDCARAVCSWHSHEVDFLLLCEDDSRRRAAESDAEALAAREAVVSDLRERLPKLAEVEPIKVEILERAGRRAMFGRGGVVEKRVIEGAFILNGDRWSNHIDLLAVDGRVLVHRGEKTTDLMLEEWLEANGPEGVRRLQEVLKAIR
jgi:hypothetical protein